MTNPNLTISVPIAPGESDLEFPEEEEEEEEEEDEASESEAEEEEEEEREEIKPVRERNTNRGLYHDDRSTNSELQD